MAHNHPFYLIGYASGLAGKDAHVAEGSLVMKESPYLSKLTEKKQNIYWDEILTSSSLPVKDPISVTKILCKALSEIVRKKVSEQSRFCVIGGDHTSAIGTWSGVHHALKNQGDIGLIWIDAHMDSHTHKTTISGNIHGMPLAALLGHGDPSLTNICNPYPKIKPENLCLIGVRSYESGEEALLKSLNVRVYSIEEVQSRGFQSVFHEALSRVKKHTIGYGISLDLDSIDPKEAPAVDVPEPNGIHVTDVYDAIRIASNDDKLIGLEIVEFDPSKDIRHITEKIIVNILSICTEISS